MKDSEFNIALKDGFAGISGILIYGPDRGLVLEYYDKITKHFNENGDGLSVVDYDMDRISHDPSDFFADCISDSFFCEKKLVRVKDADEKFGDIMEKLMTDPISSFIVATSDNLPKNSKLRAFFEKNRFCETIPCYQDNTKSIMDIISAFFYKKGIMIGSEAKSYIANHLGDNRALTMSELEKMSLYVGNKKEIKYEDARNSLSSGEIIEMDDFIFGIMEGNFNQFLKAQDKFLNEGITSVGLVRSLLTHIKSLYKMRAEYDKSKNLLESIKKVNPRVFFKNQDNYMKQVKKLNQSSLIKIIEELYKAEKNLKSSEYSYISDIYGKRFFLTLSQFCKKLG